MVKLISLKFCKTEVNFFFCKLLIVMADTAVAAAEAPAGPKLSVKMLVFPIMFFAVKKVDLKDPDVLNLARIGFCASVGLLMLVWFYIYSKVNGSTDEKTVWIPPTKDDKADWMLKLMGQPTSADAVVKKEDYVKTTMKAHEAPLVNKEIQSIMFTFVMGMVMTMQFGVHQVLVMQGVLLPVNATDNVLIQKYLFGKTEGDNGKPLYGMLTSDPCLDKDGKPLPPTPEPAAETDDAKVEIISETPAKDTGVKKRNVAAKKEQKEDMANID
jgi:hypothetical protein